MKIKILLLILLLLGSLQQVVATDFTYQGVNYTTWDMPDGECATKEGSYTGANPFHNITAGTNNLSGDLVIPDKITISGRTYTVTKISDYSFTSFSNEDSGEGANHITSVVIPHTVKTIGKYAFLYNNSLKKVVIGKSITTIGDRAFTPAAYIGLPNEKNCAVYILANTPPKIDSGIGEKHEVFGDEPIIHVPYGCKQAYSGWIGTVSDDADVSIVNELIYQYDPLVSEYAVAIGSTNSNITNLRPETNVSSCLDKTLPVTEIGSNAFSSYKDLQEVVIPDGILTMGDNAFQFCSNLKNISLGNTVKTIGDKAFLGTKLEFLGLPASVQSIGKQTFEGNSELEYIMLGKGIKSIGYDAFRGCSKLSEVELEDLAAWCGVQLESWCSNPMYYSHGFSIRGKKQTTLTIPEGVISIQPRTFIYCTDITALNLAESVESICGDAFTLSGLVKLDDTKNVKMFAYQAFYSCKNLESVVLSEKMESIGQRAFHSCPSLKTVTVSKSLKQLQNFAFADCSALSTIDVGEGLGNVGAGAFNECKALTCVNTSSMTGWCNQTFANEMANPLYYAKRLTLNGKDVSDITIGDEILSINDFSFINCSTLKSFDTGVGIKSIGAKALAGCSNLKELLIGKNVESISNEAFNDATNLSTVTFGTNLKTLGSGLFLGCANLSTLIALMDTAPLQTEACFEEVAYSNATLYVNSSSYATYRITAPWKGFRRIQDYEIAIDMAASGILGDELNMLPGESKKLIVSVSPEEASNRLSWTSSDEAVATVDSNGIVEAISTGNAVIQVAAENGPSAKIVVNVGSSSIEKIFAEGFDSSFEVYDLTGLCIAKTATAENFKSFTPGIYIIRTSKESFKYIVR